MNHRVALITGSSKGIGRAIAIQLAKDGFDVVINYNGSHEKALETERLCQVHGVKTLTLQCDVSDYDAVNTMIQTIIEAFGQLDVLVNNSGITKDNLILRMSEADFDSVVDVNLKGTFNTIKSVSKMMFKAKYGRIVNLSSVIGLTGNLGQSNYAASKAGVIGLSKSVAREFASKNITCNVVAPGYIETDMTESLPDSVKTTVLAHIPMKRLGRVEDVAGVVSFLVSEKADYITGQVIVVDGGMVT
jgi:3-oxoacyl-[acyl-carrier protein] reductase